MHPLIIIGAGLAGWTTVREFRKLDTTTPVVVITADSGDFYAKPSLSNAFAQRRSPEQLVTTPGEKMALSLDVTLLAHTRVTALDIATHTLAFDLLDEPQTLRYSQLVLATGAQPIRMPLQGDAADQVRAINSLDDFSLFHLALSPRGTSTSSSEIDSKIVVIMGAGLIGCEFANDLLHAGHRVHVVDPSDRPLAALLPTAASEALRHALVELGVQWHFEDTVQSVDRITGQTGLRVGLSSGASVHADAVLSAIGLRADTHLAAAAGVHCERGIVTDPFLQTSAPDVYALGDCAQYASAGQRTLPFVMPIMHAARALAATLAGTPTVLGFPLMPVSVKTPALPIVVASPQTGLSGDWQADTASVLGIWRFVDGEHVQRGFVLTGTQTARRMELARSTVP